MNIGIDIDGCMINSETCYSKVREYLERRGIPNEKEYKGVYEVAARFGISPEVEADFWKTDGVKYIQEAKPMENCVDVIKRLREEGHSINILTNRGTHEIIKKEERWATVDWLNENDIPCDTLTFCKDKVERFHSLGGHIMLEDDPTNVERFVYARDRVIVPIVDYTEQFFIELERVKTWLDFYAKVKEIGYGIS